MNNLVITDLRLEQFRKFARPVRLSGLGPGLNLLCAPNEAGKSTLKAALDAAFFTRHRVGGQTAEALRTQGNDAPPVVQVGFRLGDDPYTLIKRFHRQHRARLQRPDGSVAEGEAAEEELQSLLGFETIGGRGARAEALGVWGLLWVAQGDSFALPDISASARGSLEECLAGGEVATVTGGVRGHRVAERVRAELAKYLTQGRRQPTGRYAQVLQEEKEAQVALDAANALKAELTGQLDELETCRRDRDAEERGIDLVAEEREIQVLRQQFSEAQRLADQAANAKLNLELAERGLTQAEEAAARRDEMVKQENGAAAAVTAAVAAHSVEADAVVATANALALAEQAFANADTAWKQAGRVLQHLADGAKWQRLKSAAGEKQVRLEQALSAARASTAAAREAQTLPATDAALKKLRILAGKRDAAAAARAAAATVLRFSLTGDGRRAVALNGTSIPETDAVVLTRTAVLDLGVLGKIEVRPGVQDAAAIDQSLSDAEHALTAALQSLQCMTPAEAETQGERRRHLLQAAAAAAERARVYAPELDGKPGLIAESLEAVKAETAKADDALAAMAVPEGGAMAEEEATAALRQAEAERQDRNDALARERQAHALAEQSARQAGAALQAARDSHAAAVQALDTARASAADQALAMAVADAQQALAAAQSAYEAAQEKSRNSGAPDRIQDQIGRKERGREERGKRIAKLRETIASLEAQVRAKAERGPDEAIRDSEERLARLSLEKQRLERDVEALQMLGRVLRDAQAEAEAQYLAPVTARLRPHLTALFGEAAVGMAGDFSLQTLQRHRLTEDIAQLSAGTQEQLAILSRLAFADVLAEQGRPVVLLLDDALVYADDRRIQDMFGALERAAERFQVIVLSCRQRVFDGLGGADQRRLTIEACEPIDV